MSIDPRTGCAYCWMCDGVKDFGRICAREELSERGAEQDRSCARRAFSPGGEVVSCTICCMKKNFTKATVVSAL